MTDHFNNEQEKFWAGDFGDMYIERNQGAELHASKLNIFSDILSRTRNVGSVLELGGNIGMNIKAINCLLPNAKTSAVEINARAYEQLKEVCTGQAYLTSILDMQSNVQQSFDFVFTQTVLIHINPNDLQSVYEMMYKYSRRYICVTEYYNPTPVEIVYRGETGKLFKRNFAGEILDKYPDLELVDYGFKYIRDPNFIQDDLTWFLLQKR